MADALFAGSFDPVTLGHLDVIRRAGRIFDSLVVAVAVNAQKRALFTREERLGFLSDALQGVEGVTVDQFEGLAVAYAREKGCRVLVRGLRTAADFEYEYPMAMTNRTFAPELETVFVVPDPRVSLISSRLIKEVVLSGGDVSGFVPEHVVPSLVERLRSEADGG